jgi:hypothetical protein
MNIDKDDFSFKRTIPIVAEISSGREGYAPPPLECGVRLLG